MNKVSSNLRRQNEAYEFSHHRNARTKGTEGDDQPPSSAIDPTNM